MIKTLLDSLRSLDIISYTEDDINDILDGRDSDDFDSEWCRVDSEIEEFKNADNYTSLNEKEHDDICKEAFFIIENKLSSELSDYVSDDFGLIYDSIVVGYHDPWLSGLIGSYQKLRIPSGDLFSG